MAEIVACGVTMVRVEEGVTLNESVPFARLEVYALFCALRAASVSFERSILDPSFIVIKTTPSPVLSFVSLRRG